MRNLSEIINTETEFGTVREAARRFGLSRSRLYCLAGSGQIKFIKVGGATIVDFATIRRFLFECNPATIRPPKDVSRAANPVRARGHES